MQEKCFIMNADALLLAACAAVASWLTLFPLRAYLRRARRFDVPNDRSLHTTPTPRGGGLVIVVLVLVLAAAFTAIYLPDAWGPFLAYGTGAALVAAVSGWDDVKSVSGAVRFTVHFLAAALALVGLEPLRTVSLPGMGLVSFGWLALPLALFSIVALTNFYNFMDGINGMAGSQGVVAGIGWLILGWITDVPFVAALGGLLAATCLGFLWHNWSPARIFMGDVGSAFLGYTFAVLPLLYAAFAVEASERGLALLFGFIVVWPFVFDATFTLLCRLARGENIFAPHRTHLYQRLVLAGYSHSLVSLLYAALAGLGVSLAAVWASGVQESGIALAVLLPLLCLGLWAFVVYQERLQAEALRAK